MTILILLTTFRAFGQDIHFSQYFNSPLSLNPSETGNFQGDWRGIVNYRNQWSSLGFPYKTFSASYDQQYYFKKQHFSPGFYVVHDNSGSSALRVNMVYASLGYHREYLNNFLSAGIQVGYVMEDIDYSQLTFPDQFNLNDGTFSIPSGNSLGKNHLGYLDINAGVSWKRKINRYEPEAGLSFFHVNHPTESFINDPSSKKPLRSAFYASVKTDLSHNLYLKPGIMLFSLRGSSDMMIGSQVGITLPGNSFNLHQAYGGLYLRNGIISAADALMILAGAQVYNLDINISYDVNISPLSTYTSNRGAFELSLIFKNVSAILKTFTIPCERF